MIAIKSNTVFFELVIHAWHPVLLELITWMEKHYSGRVLITSGFRLDDGGIHETVPLRAVDLRSTSFHSYNPVYVAEEINDRWDYGKGRIKVCVFHRRGVCKTCRHKFELDVKLGVIASTKCPKCHGWKIKDYGPHFHLQVRNETRRK